MPQQKVKMVAAILAGILMGFALLSLSYIALPQQASQPPPPLPTAKAESLESQILWVAQWIGLAAIIAVAFAGVVLVAIRAKNKFSNQSAKLPQETSANE